MDKFTFRFKQEGLKKEFNIIAIRQDKSMADITEELIAKYVKENK